MALTATVGHEEELDSIRAFIDAVPRGPTALSISGQAGIGKTILWETGVEAAHERFGRVLLCRGIEAEASLSFAALSELITPIFDEVAPALTTPRRRALEVALLLVDADGSPPDFLAIGLAVFESLRALTAAGPCLIAIDDAQWLDSSSATVLQVALKRLNEEPVGLLLTMRDTPGVSPPIALDSCFGAGRVRSVTLGPITLAPLHHLLRDRLRLDLTRPELNHLHTMTGGNPFFALEVGREMVRTNTRTTDAGGLRVPDSLRALVGGRLARLPTETGDVLLTMAALARPTIEVLVTADGDRDRVLRALDVAEGEGVVRLDDSRIRFSHPLHSSICYQQAPVWKRQAVHRALADAVTDLEERALHLARATDMPDAAVAAELDTAAESAAARGAPAVGAEFSELAARLTPSADAAESRRRRARAATLHYISGSAERARAAFEELLGEVPCGVERADLLLGLCSTRLYEIPAWLSLCDEALVEAGDDHARAAKILVHRTQALIIRGDVHRALVDARAALEHAEAIADPTLTASAIARISHAELYDAEPTSGLDERGVEIERSAALALEYLNSPRCALARRLMRTGDVDTARVLLEEVNAEAVARGDERSRGQVLWLLTQLEWLAGRWTIALGRATEAVATNEQVQEAHGLPLMGRHVALLQADLGLVDDARTLAAASSEAARALSDDFFEVSALAVLGRIELMIGNLEAAGAWLRDLPNRLVGLGLNDPTVPMWPDALEVLVALGETETARGWLDHWEAQARRLGGPLALAATARCRGLLAAADGEPGRAIEAFEQSLRELEGVTYPLEHARTLLSMGSVLRQAQQRGAARDALEQAIAILDELGARLWAEKARAELARISGRRPPSEVLTETERQVAVLAARGQSNKEIAASLHMGVSTVEAHLSNIYRKLNVKRVELAKVLAELAT